MVFFNGWVCFGGVRFFRCLGVFNETVIDDDQGYKNR